MSPPYPRLLRLARRWSRDPAEAEDLVQSALLAAWSSGRRDLNDPAVLAWLAGTIRRMAAMAARGAVRRRRREAEYGRAQALPEAPGLPVPDAAGLPPALARTARLIAAGCTRAELRFLLGISDAALRQRLMALRRQARPAEVTPGAAAGLARRALLGPLRRAPGAVLGSQDPDGHLFAVGRSQSGGPRQPTGA